MEFQEFDVHAYFTHNYGMDNKPAVSSLNIKKTLLGLLFVAVGIAVMVLLSSWNTLVAGILALVLVVTGLILMLPTVLTKVKTKRAANAWQAEYDHRKNTWDREFDKFYDKTVYEMHLRETAMYKIGITEDQLCDVKPFFIYGAILNGAQDLYRTDEIGVIRADHNEITWLFFSKDQVYLYNINFRFTAPKRSETTQEFFYQDIVSVTIVTESTVVDTTNCIDGVASGVIDIEKFKLIVPGDKMSFAFTSSTGVAGSIQAMKSKIRDKKVG